MFIKSIEKLPLASAVPLEIFYTEYSLEDFQPGLYIAEAIKPLKNFEKCVKKRQAEYLAGRCCAKSALEAISIRNFDILSAEDRSPIWPSGIVGSITHSHRFAAATANLAATYRGVGIDLERVFDAQRLKLKEHICSPREIGYLQSLSSQLDINHLFTLAFSAKESIYKALFPIVKIFFYFDSVEVQSIDIPNRKIKLRVVKAVGDKLLPGAEFDCHYQPLNEECLLTYCAIE